VRCTTCQGGPGTDSVADAVGKGIQMQPAWQPGSGLIAADGPAPAAASLLHVAINNYRLALNSSWTRWFERRPQHTPAKSPRAGPRAIVVIGRKPKARASTVTLELTACPARDAREAEMWPVTSPADYDQPPNASCVVVSVVAVEGCRVCFLDRRAGPRVSAPTPEDDCVPHLAASTEATFVASPDVAQVRELAEVIAREA